MILELIACTGVLAAGSMGNTLQDARFLIVKRAMVVSP